MFQSIYKTMLSYYLKCRKNTESKNPKVIKKKNGRIMTLLKHKVCDSKKIVSKEQEANRLLSSVEIKITLSKLLLVGPVLF